MNAHFLLEQIQKDSVDTETDRYMRENSDVEMINREAVTYFAFYDAIHSLFSVLPAFIQHWKGEYSLKNVPESSVIFGTAARPEFGSSAYRVNDEYLLVFHDGLLSFINEMSTLVTYFLFIEDEISYYNLVENLENKPELVKEFIEKMLAYDLFSHTWWGQQRKIESSELFWKIRDAIAGESIKFVCAHELGHVVCGHLDKDFELDKEQKILWKKEYQADRFAALIMFQEYKIHPVFPSVAIAMTVSILECLDRMRGSFLEKGDDEHPLSYLRRNKLGGISWQASGTEAASAFSLTVGLMEILWEELMEFVQYLMYQEGVQIEKDNFRLIQNILHKKYELPDKNFDALLELIFSGQERIVKGFYNFKTGSEGMF